MTNSKSEVRPFRGIRYSDELTKSATQLVAPPYDNISEEQKQELLQRHPKNVVRLILPEQKGDADWYPKAAEMFRAWREDGTLTRDTEPAIYLYEQAFDAFGHKATRRGFMAVKRLEERGAGGTHPHEKTFEGPKADRLKLMHAVGANMSPIFVIYSDEKVESLQTLDAASPQLILEAEDQFGAKHRLYKVTDEKAHKKLEEIMAGRELLIADGHHRYETALNYRDAMREKHPDAGPEALWNFQMMFFSPMEDPGLVVLPWHRGIKPGPVPEDLEKRLDAYFTVTRLTGKPASEVTQILEDASANGTAFSLYRGGNLTLLAAKPEAKDEMARLYPDAKEEPLQRLEVNILHRLVIDGALGLTDEDYSERLTFIRDPQECVRRVDSGELAMVFFLRGAPVEQVAEIARAGLKMPQKSTDFFPKLLSGLLFNPLHE